MKDTKVVHLKLPAMRAIQEDPEACSEREVREAAFWDEIRLMDARRLEAQESGLPALGRLVTVARGDTGQSRHVGRFLLGLYNGSTYPLDLTSLRCVDYEIHQDCLRVLAMDYAPTFEVHELIPNGSAIWEDFKQRWGTDE